MSGNKGHHIRLSEETEGKLIELIDLFSNGKATIMSQAIDEMHEKYIPKKVENFKCLARIPFAGQLTEKLQVLVEHVSGQYDVFLLMGNNHSHVLTRYDLDTYRNQNDAVRSAELFPSLYKIAVEKGFSITQRFFVNYETGRRVHVSYAMDTDITQERFVDILDDIIPN